MASSALGGTPAGQISFDGTWEGSSPTSAWTGVKVSFGGGSFSFLKDPGRRGTVARVTLPANGTAAIEAIHHRPLLLGETTVYGLAFKFPKGWQLPTKDWGCLIAQLGYPLLKYTNIGLGVGADYVGLEMHTGFINWNGRTPSADNPATFDLYRPSRDPAGFVIPPNRFATGVWHLVLLEVTWSMTETGSLRAWHQVQGEKTWTKTVEFRNIPTMQWGIGITGAIMSIDGIDGGGKPRKVSDKVGAYRYEGPNAVTYLNDGLLIGTTPNVVAPRLQGTPFSPVVLRSRPRAAVLGRPYRARLLETGGVAPLSWSVAGAFPPGLRLTGADGVIAGSARKAGSWRVTVTVRDALGAQSSRPATLRVRR